MEKQFIPVLSQILLPSLFNDTSLIIYYIFYVLLMGCILYSTELPIIQPQLYTVFINSLNDNFKRFLAGKMSCSHTN